jgi:hypothetical protein
MQRKCAKINGYITENYIFKRKVGRKKERNIKKKLKIEAK